MPPFLIMQIDLGLVFAVLGGAGTVLGTIAASEKYISSKFKGAVIGILRELEYDREIRHIKRQLAEVEQLMVRIQDAAVDEQLKIGDKIHRVDAKTVQAFAAINDLKIRQAKLESAARVLGAKFKGDASITAILMNETSAS